MNTTPNKQLQNRHNKETKSIVNGYIDQLNQNVIANFTNKQKMQGDEHQYDSNNCQKQQQDKRQFNFCLEGHNRAISGFGQKLRQKVDNEKQPIYSADFETYHQLEDEEDHKYAMQTTRQQNAENINSKQLNQFGSKQGENCEQAGKSMLKLKKNIRVHNKSTPHINKNSQVKQYTYNQLRDKTLVQYFYPRQKKIFRQTVNKLESIQSKLNDNCKISQPKQSKLVKKCQSERNQNLAFRLKKTKQSIYKTKNDCGRKIAFNSYDLVSCSFSMKQYQLGRTLNVKQNQKGENENQQPDQSVLQHRIKNMQEKVYKKMPFLVQMGVKFKTARTKY